jgi:hypothetical protein
MQLHTPHTALVALAAGTVAALACGLPLTATAPAPTEMLAQPALPLASAAPSETAIPTLAVTETASATPTLEFTATPSGPLIGTVLQRSNCRYGPGAFFLYKMGMREGAPIEVIGRSVDGGWAYIQFKGTTNLCWINSKLIQAEGDIMSLPDYYPDNSSLPRATNYGPVTITSVSGGGASVTVEWLPIVLPDYAMPDEPEVQYVIEVWSCFNGEPAFYSYGTNETEMTFEVDDSCGQLSHADIVAQNKAGVSGITNIPLP